MTGRACDGALARTFQVDVMLVCKVEDAVSFTTFDGFDECALGIAEMYFDSTKRTSMIEYLERNLSEWRKTQLTQSPEPVFLFRHAFSLHIQWKHS